MEKTLVLIKTDGVGRGLTGKIIQRFEDAGLKIIGLKMVWIDKKFAGKHYFDVAERHGQMVFKAMTAYLSEGPVVAIVLEGVDAVKVVRKITGSTYPNEALPGTIRGDFSHHSREWADKGSRPVKNLIHASSKLSEAKQEIKLWFKPAELHSYENVHERHTF